jgi:flagellar hook-basal body complex protein FliE
MNPIQNYPIPISPGQLSLQPAQQLQGGSSFKNFLLDSIRQVNSMQQDADQAVEQLMAGNQDVTPAEVLTAVQKADIAFRMMIQIRNKMVQAYQEVQNIRV